jgi:hypothetical protein
MDARYVTVEREGENERTDALLPAAAP